MATISVIIPIYNVEKYLKRCLDSVCNQTFRDLEIICVNDGSTDNSLKILEEYKDERIQIINKENGGLSSARNAGLDLATSPYIAFVDSDDYLENTAFEKALKPFEDEEIDFVSYGANIVVEGVDESSSMVQDAKTYHNIKFSGKKQLDDDTIWLSTVTVWNKLFKAEKMKDIRFPIGLLYEDNNFFHKYVMNCKYGYYLDEYLYNYIQRKNSIIERMMNGESGKFCDRLKNFEDVYRYYEIHGEVDNHLNLMKYTLKNYLQLDFLYSKDNDKKAILDYATKIANNINNNKLKKCSIVKNLRKKRYRKIKCLGFKRKPSVFNLYNESNHKILEIFWIKIKFKKGNRKLKFKSLMKDLKFKLAKFVLPFKIRNLDTVMPQPKTLNNDENIKNAIKALNDFYFLPNKGNSGDIVIAFSEFQYFDANNFSYKVYDIFNQPEEDFNLVYGGGGIWLKLYEDSYKEILDIFKSDKLKQCVILPSSFYECDEVINTFDERFTVFCREKQSYDYCTRLNKKAKFYLADDMVIGADFDCLKGKIVDISRLKTNANLVKDIESAYENYNYTVKKAIKNLKKYRDFKIGYLLRSDEESVFNKNFPLSIDPSSFAGSHACDNALNTLISKLFLTVIDQFDIVVTDRLHIGICASKLGKKTLLLDNSYKKVSNVYENSLKNFTNTKLTTETNLSKDIEKFVAHNASNSKKMKLEDIQLTVSEFLIAYNSLKNEYGCEKIFWK